MIKLEPGQEVEITPFGYKKWNALKQCNIKIGKFIEMNGGYYGFDMYNERGELKIGGWWLQEKEFELINLPELESYL